MGRIVRRPLLVLIILSIGLTILLETWTAKVYGSTVENPTMKSEKRRKGRRRRRIRGRKAIGKLIGKLASARKGKRRNGTGEVYSSKFQSSENFRIWSAVLEQESINSRIAAEAAERFSSSSLTALRKKVMQKLLEYWPKKSTHLNSNNNASSSSSSGSFSSPAAYKRRILHRFRSAQSGDLFEEEEDYDEITQQSDFTLPGRKFVVVTTAALPWFTGTAVNPLLRAAHLCRMTRQINSLYKDSHHYPLDHNATFSTPMPSSSPTQMVSLVIPWLIDKTDRIELYGPINSFQTPTDQEQFIRNWMAHDADLADVASSHTGLKIIFYPARYHPALKSIFPMGDILSVIPDEDSDIGILEEPEHLNWYRPSGQTWPTKFNYVVGIIHTNYKEYASSQLSGIFAAPTIGLVSSAIVRAYCHKIIKLSDVLQTFASEKEVTSNVHGVRQEFLKEGSRRASAYNTTQVQINGSGTYFIGKLLWAKGLDLMLDLQDYYRHATGDFFPIDVYGSGPDQDEIIKAFFGRKYTNQIMDEDDTGKAHQGIVETQCTDNTVMKNSSSTLFSQCDETLSSSEQSSSWTLLMTAKSLLKQQATKLSDTIRSTADFELPKTRYELRRWPILNATFPGRVDHAILKHQYKIFINPSISEVLCTTTAEALAMGKFVIIPLHPSNVFFTSFPNCLTYRNKDEFVSNLRWALIHDPMPMTPEQLYEFSWDAAMERLVRASAISNREAKERERLGLSKLDERIGWIFNELGKGETGDLLRKVLGGGPISKQSMYEKKQPRDQKSSSLRDTIRTAFTDGVFFPNVRFDVGVTTT